MHYADRVTLFWDPRSARKSGCGKTLSLSPGDHFCHRRPQEELRSLPYLVVCGLRPRVGSGCLRPPAAGCAGVCGLRPRIYTAASWLFAGLLPRGVARLVATRIAACASRRCHVAPARTRKETTWACAYRELWIRPHGLGSCGRLWAGGRVGADVVARLRAGVQGLFAGAGLAGFLTVFGAPGAGIGGGGAGMGGGGAAIGEGGAGGALGVGGGGDGAAAADALAAVAAFVSRGSLASPASQPTARRKKSPPPNAVSQRGVFGSSGTGSSCASAIAE